MNAQIIEGLKAVRDGINIVLEAWEKDLVNVTRVKEDAKEKIVDTVSKEKAPVEEVIPAEAKNVVTREQLEGMTYNNIKKLAKELGVSATGNRDEITARILGEDSVSESETPVKGSAKKTAKVEEPEEVEVDEKDNDPLYAKVVEVVADMDNEDLADILADIGISAKGKREALVEKVVQAVRDGLLDFDDEEEVEDTSAPAKVSTGAPVPVDVDEEEEDLTNDIDNPEMTEARKNAILAQDSNIRKQFKKGEVTRDNLVEFLQSFYDTDEDMSNMSDDEVLDTYIDAVCRLVDDDGDLIEEGAYTLNGEPACCGRVLAYSEDTNLFICEHCGEEYEAE